MLALELNEKFADLQLLSDAELTVLSKKLATKKIMNKNGFIYLHGGMLEDYKPQLIFQAAGQAKGLFSIGHKYVHADDLVTYNLSKYADKIAPIIQNIIDKKPINSNNRDLIAELIEKWLEEHVLQDKPGSIFSSKDNDPDQIKYVKEKYNAAIEELRERMKQQIKTKSDIKKFIQGIRE